MAQELQCHLIIVLVGRPDLKGVLGVAHCALRQRLPDSFGVRMWVWWEGQPPPPQPHSEGVGQERGAGEGRALKGITRLFRISLPNL